MEFKGSPTLLHSWDASHQDIAPAEIRPVVRYSNAVYPHEFPLLYELKN